MLVRTTPFGVYLLALGLSLAVAACDGGDSPRRPSS
jgi:hypothetical protein